MSRKKRLRRAAYFEMKEKEAAEVNEAPIASNEVVESEAVVVEKSIDTVAATEEIVTAPEQTPSKGFLSNWFKKETSEE